MTTAASKKPTTDLIEIARKTWSPKVLAPLRPALLKTRPIMLFEQTLFNKDWYEEVPDIGSVEAVRKQCSKFINELAPFSHHAGSAKGAAACCWLVIESGYMPVKSALYGGGSQGREKNAAKVGTSIDKLFSGKAALFPRKAALFPRKVALKRKYEYGECSLYSMFVLPDPKILDFVLSDVEDYVDSMDDWTAFFFDTEDGTIKYQGWTTEGRDTGYLEALDRGEDSEEYVWDAEPLRAFLLDLTSRLAANDVVSVSAD